MQNNSNKNSFLIEDFSPKSLKKARLSLEKHLHAVKGHAQTNEGYKKGVLKEPTFWEKIKHVLHMD
jgi:hypothetical protein